MKNPIRGQRISWKFIDGPTAGKSFEHDFHEDGTLAYKLEGSDKSTAEKRYEVAQVAEKVFAVAYLAASGWTLTTILDFETGSVVGFASNEKQLAVQHGTFHVVAQRPKS